MNDNQERDNRGYSPQYDPRTNLFPPANNGPNAIVSIPIVDPLAVAERRAGQFAQSRPLNPSTGDSVHRLPEIPEDRDLPPLATTPPPLLQPPQNESPQGDQQVFRF